MAVAVDGSFRGAPYPGGSFDAFDTDVPAGSIVLVAVTGAGKDQTVTDSQGNTYSLVVSGSGVSIHKSHITTALIRSAGDTIIPGLYAYVANSYAGPSPGAFLGSSSNAVTLSSSGTVPVPAPDVVVPAEPGGQYFVYVAGAQYSHGATAPEPALSGVTIHAPNNVSGTDAALQNWGVAVGWDQNVGGQLNDSGGHPVPAGQLALFGYSATGRQVSSGSGTAYVLVAVFSMRADTGPVPPPPSGEGAGPISALRHYTNRLFEFKIDAAGALVQDLYDDADGSPVRSTIDAAATCSSVAFWLVDAALEGTYLRGSSPYLARSTNHGGDWRLTSIPGTYDGLASAPYRNRFVVLGFRSGSWYAVVGKWTGPGTYTWSAEQAVSLPFTPDGAGYLRVEDDNTLMLHARDTGGAWHLVRCHVLNLSAVGTWN